MEQNNVKSTLAVKKLKLMLNIKPLAKGNENEALIVYMLGLKFT